MKPEKRGPSRTILTAQRPDSRGDPDPSLNESPGGIALRATPELGGHNQGVAGVEPARPALPPGVRAPVFVAIPPPAGISFDFIPGRLQGEQPNMTATLPQTTQNDWVKTVLFDRGYLAQIRGDAIKVYLAIIEACDGLPDRSVTISLNGLMRRTQLSCPTVIDALARLEDLGLVVSTTHQRGKVKTYYLVASGQ